MSAEVLSALRTRPVCLGCGAVLDERRLMASGAPIGLCGTCSNGVRGPGRRRRKQGGSATVALRRIWERDLGICHLCGWPCPLEAATRDHVIPRGEGGPNTQDNIRLAHGKCNGERSAVDPRPPRPAKPRTARLEAARYIVFAQRFTWFAPIPDKVVEKAVRIVLREAERA